jgi:hypothetical protein
VTEQIELLPWNLRDVELYLKHIGINWSRYDIAIIYMVLGGIPGYLNKLNIELNAFENIDNLFFKTNGVLRNEFEILIKSLFKNNSLCKEIILLLSTKQKGMTRKELIENLKKGSGGNFTNALECLMLSRFINQYNQYPNKTNESVYQLIDNFSIFYIKFIMKNNIHNENYFVESYGKPILYTWLGYAYERICIWHIKAIKKALGISGIGSNIQAYTSKETQIDLIINIGKMYTFLIEAKFSIEPYEIDNDYNVTLLNKRETFRRETKNKGSIFIVLASVFGIKINKYSSTIYKTITLDDLFA